jgi:amino acid transporter
LSLSSETARRTSPGGYGLPTLVLLVVANMIGSGLYTTSGYSLGALGSARLVLIVWGVGGAIALMGAVAYGALARRLPLSGGEYLFLSRLVHPLVGFTAGWISLVAGFTGPLAAASLVVGAYAVGGGAASQGQVRMLSTAVLVLCGAIQMTTLGIGAWTHNLAVLAKLALLVSLLVTPLWLEPAGGWQSGYLSDFGGGGELGPLEVGLAMLGALVWVLLSYSGSMRRSTWQGRPNGRGGMSLWRCGSARCWSPVCISP